MLGYSGKHYMRMVLKASIVISFFPKRSNKCFILDYNGWTVTMEVGIR